jgi:alpha-D-xyloside xylohydrolase
MAQGWERTDTGILVSPSVGSEKAVRVDVYGNGIFRVTSGPNAKLDAAASLMVRARPVSAGFEIAETAGSVLIITP